MEQLEILLDHSLQHVLGRLLHAVLLDEEHQTLQLTPRRQSDAQIGVLLQSLGRGMVLSGGEEHEHGELAELHVVHVVLGDVDARHVHVRHVGEVSSERVHVLLHLVAELAVLLMSPAAHSHRQHVLHQHVHVGVVDEGLVVASHQHLHVALALLARLLRADVGLQLATEEHLDVLADRGLLEGAAEGVLGDLALAAVHLRGRESERGRC